MIRPFHNSATALALFLFAAGASGQSLTLTRIPLLPVPPDQPVEISWQEDVQAKLLYGLAPGDYSRDPGLRGRRTLRLVPQEAGIGPGVYYCVVTEGFLRSAEFQLIVESPTAPQMRAPANGSIVGELRPEFCWDPVPGVPYYHIIVSDREAVLSEDAEGNLRLTGANIVWQAITRGTSIRYGDSDPSGSFAAGEALTPPLVSGRTYSWIVLNNYGNSPAFTSVVQAGLFGFTTSLPSPPPNPVLLAPAPGASLATREIEFRWQGVAGVHHYELYVFELLEQEQSESSYPVFRASTTGTSYRLDARVVLKSGRYFWQVVAVGATGSSASSPHRLFTYDVAPATIRFRSWSTTGEVLPRVGLEIRAEDGSQEVTSYLTTDGGIFTLSVQPGRYRLLATKRGYADTSLTFRAEPEETADVDVVLRPLPFELHGQVRLIDGTEPDYARILARKRGTGLHVSGEAVHGRFVLRLSPGTWAVWPELPSHQAVDTASVELSTSRLTLSSPLQLRPLPAAITGRVQTAGGQPIPQATVKAYRGGQQLHARTDPAGQFRLDLLPGDWALVATSPGYPTSEPRLVVALPGQQSAVDPPLQLEAAALTIGGIVLDGDTPVPGVTIRILPRGGSYREGTTDSRGNFHVALPTGDYWLILDKPGLLTSPSVFLALQNDAGYGQLRLAVTQPRAQLRGTVLSPSGRPAAGAVVMAGAAIVDTADAAGFFEGVLPPGRYKLRAFRSGDSPSAATVIQLSEAQPLESVNLQLGSQGARIRGAVRSNGSLLSFAAVRAISGSDTIWAQADWLGRYELAVSPGLWTVQVSRIGYAPAIRSGLAVSPGQTLAGVDFNLVESTAQLSGWVRDDRGRAVAGARIALSDGSLVTFSRADGSYELRLPPGQHVLKAAAAGFGERSESISLGMSQSSVLNFSLPSWATVSGRVTTSAGTPIWDAVVLAISGRDTTRVRTDHTGEYEIFLPAGNYTLLFDQLGYRSGTRSVQLQGGESYTLNVALAADPSEMASLSGNVRTTAGSPAPGIHLSLRGREKRNLTTSFDGTYRVERLEAGFAFDLTPTRTGLFFVPPVRQYRPLTGNLTGQDFEAAYYGDVSGNDRVTSFDGSLVLRISAEQDVRPYFTRQPRDSIAADVSGNGTVSSFDASLIFRYAAGLIQQFPADRAPEWLPKAASLAEGTLATLATEDLGEELVAVLQLEGSAPFYSLDARLDYAPASLSVLGISTEPEDSSLHLAHQASKNTLRIALASLRPLAPAELRIRFLLRKTDPSAPAPSLVSVQVDEQEVPIRGKPSEPVAPLSLQAAPNPFNESTILLLTVPLGPSGTKDRVELCIFDVLGREIWHRAVPILKPGVQRVRWEGRDDQGLPVPSGVYLVRLQASGKVLTRKIVCVR
ncbi:MAG: carboxypeptidase regulatory-like domain-containing protein [candidate division KSB1 bacterium]|nr:carboxypeptidase regulatory-like domain-containing protein [candidate division KSB1 bacterium]